MRKLAVLLIAAVTALLLAGCASDSTARDEPFVGQWESTGGEQISLQVDAPTNGRYPVRLVGGELDIKKSATRVNDTEYHADPEWTFRMVDEELMTVTITGDSGSATTSFKRIGG